MQSRNKQMQLFRILFIGMLLISGLTHAETVKIYAAASLTNAITDISKLYQQQHRNIRIIPVLEHLLCWPDRLQQELRVISLFLQILNGCMIYLKTKISIGQIRPLLLNELVLISPIQQKPF